MHYRQSGIKHNSQNSKRDANKRTYRKSKMKHKKPITQHKLRRQKTTIKPTRIRLSALNLFRNVPPINPYIHWVNIHFPLNTKGMK